MLKFSSATKFRPVKTLAISATAIAMGSWSLLPDAASHALRDTTHITADFDNIAGIYEGNPVTVLGLEVGKVEKITPKGALIEVRLSIEPEVKIPKEAVAVVVSPSIVTDRHIELTPVYTQGEPLSDGAHLPKSRTKTPVELDTMIKTTDQFAAALKPQEGVEGVGPMSVGCSTSCSRATARRSVTPSKRCRPR